MRSGDFQNEMRHENRNDQTYENLSGFNNAAVLLSRCYKLHTSQSSRTSINFSKISQTNFLSSQQMKRFLLAYSVCFQNSLEQISFSELSSFSLKNIIKLSFLNASGSVCVNKISRTDSSSILL